MSTEMPMRRPGQDAVKYHVLSYDAQILAPMVRYEPDHCEARLALTFMPSCTSTSSRVFSDANHMRRRTIGLTRRRRSWNRRLSMLYVSVVSSSRGFLGNRAALLNMLTDANQTETMKRVTAHLIPEPPSTQPQLTVPLTMPGSASGSKGSSSLAN